jgi:hypothetical protein
MVNVRNQTSSKLSVRVRLQEHLEDLDVLELGSEEEQTLLKYDEERRTTAPITNFVTRVEFTTPDGCVGWLDSRAIASAATRSRHARRWTIVLTPAIVNAACPAPAPMP